ncbi:MAG: class I mannose-6-phosphate isomerase [Sedimentisphaerales bacterium]|jgi:mannose-6-phosphate isomerase|nr:class I mannose-6-phosphate isomerase [Sedimentisphaerales bacterium]
MRWYPLRFKPIYKERIWGGRRLQEVFGKDLPAGKLIGESWELVDLPPADCSIVDDGPLAGQTIDQVVRRYAPQIGGKHGNLLPFPLLVKFLDAQQILSVQVHPDINACKRLGKGQPKSECWYVIDARPGTFIYKGLRPGTTRDQLADALGSGQLEGLLNKVYVQPGQCHYLPAGTVHALGPGILVAEIQTLSDTTFRLYDWGRVDHSGRPRPVHVPEALESIRFDLLEQELLPTTAGRLVDGPYFSVDKRTATAGQEDLLPPGIMKVVLVTKGSGLIYDTSGHHTMAKAGDCLLVPAVFEGAICAQTDMEYLVVTLENSALCNALRT